MTESNLYLKRIIFTDESTIGELYWHGGEFECSTLEDTCRRDSNSDGFLQKEEKVFGKTAIPAGRYEILMQESSRYQRKMPFLQNVPYFSGIMIHWGNKPEDTNGCILVGSKNEGKEDWVSASQIAYNAFEPKILAAIRNGKLFINIDGGLRV